MTGFAAPLSGRFFRFFLVTLATLLAALAVTPLAAAPYAALVMDARTGEVLHATNADTRLHPASLTKMMTLYITFEAIKRGEISLDTVVTISSKAANEPPSKLGLKAGQRIKVRYLIRAAAIKSANDAATALGEAVSGSEAAFARRMNRTAKAVGMTRTTFKNANGLTEEGHLSTARDMAVLGRRLFYDHPDYYNLFSRRSSDAGGRKVNNTNTRFLNAYKGADGIKTGYTRAAGFNLVASAERGSERIIASVFGGQSTAARNAKMAELLDLGFRRAPSNARVKKPALPVYADVEDEPSRSSGKTVIVGNSAAAPGAAGKKIRVSGSVTRSLRPRPRPGQTVETPPAALLAAMEGGIADALTAVMASEVESAKAIEATELAPNTVLSSPPPRPENIGRTKADAEADIVTEETVQLAEADISDDQNGAEAPLADQSATVAEAENQQPAEAVQLAEAAETELDADPLARGVSASVAMAEADQAEPAEGLADEEILLAEADEEPVSPDAAADILTDDTLLAEIQPQRLLRPAPAPDRSNVVLASLSPVRPEIFDGGQTDPVIVTRLSTSGGRHYGINVGSFNSRYEAEKVLLKTALQEITTLDEALRKVVKTKTGFDANFMGLTEDMASLACRRLSARNVPCTTLGAN